MNKFKGLLFDLDGVIVDTAKYHYLAWKSLTRDLGIDFTQEDNERLKGVSRLASLEIILEIGKLKMSQEEKERNCTKKNNLYVTYIEKLTKDDILPGVRALLEDSRNKGYKIALGSASKNSSLILNCLELTELFDVIIDGNKVSKAKPDPEVFVRGAERLGLDVGLDVSDCIVFEDAIAGIRAAHNGGMKAVGLGNKEILIEADIVIEGFKDTRIEDIITQLN
ncbi:MAG: beta-phosphoglucomutase [Anaerocolumna sp.]